MAKNDPPLRDRKKDYPTDLDFIASHLLAISDRDYQLRVWCKAEGPEVDWYSERMLDFETGIDYFKTLLREGKTSLSSLQVKAILRVYVMACYFDNLPEENLEGWTEQQLHIVNHPYWQKIQKQAAHALSLLKNDDFCNKPLQIYGSIGTRTANPCPNLTGRFVDRMRVFSNQKLRTDLWKSRKDFWHSIERYDLVFKKYFDGQGSLPSNRHFDALLAFQKALDKLCEPYEDSGGNLTTILTDPNFKEVEQRARDFLKLPSGSDQSSHIRV